MLKRSNAANFSSIPMKPLRLAIVGCGHISQQYADHIKFHPDLLEIVGATDLDVARAEAFCKQNGGIAYASFEAMLADPTVDIMVNLTVHHAHYELNTRALKAGKHVYSEKPMALCYEQARELCELARKCQRRLGSAPSTFLGEGIQTTARFLEEGGMGQIRLVYAEVNWGAIERWISAPAPYFTVGPLLDVGVYAITALTYLMGPVKKVWGYSTILKTPRQGQNGQEFSVTAPDFTTGMMEFENGVKVRITTNYYVPQSAPHLRGLEFFSDAGTLTVSDYHDFPAKCSFTPANQVEAEDIPLLREAKVPMDRAAGLAELARALHEDRPHRSSGEHAAHVIEVMEGLQRSMDESRFVEITSSFENPGLTEWARQITPVTTEKSA